MDRRDFIKMAPAAAAGMAVVGSVGLTGASDGLGGHEGALVEGTAQGGSGGFRLVGETYHLLPGELALDRLVVECPYPVGSKAWIAIGDRDEKGGLTVMGHKSVTGTYRRVIFPRFTLREGEDLEERALEVYRAVCEHGFDGARGADHAWKVVHVEYRCPDGVEHVMCGMPVPWDSRLALGVMVKGQIG